MLSTSPTAYRNGFRTVAAGGGEPGDEPERPGAGPAGAAEPDSTDVAPDLRWMGERADGYPRGHE
jgi:hypothetical protein